MAIPEQEAMSAEAFLGWVTNQTERHELVDGIPVRMMAGARQSHNVVTSNMLVRLVPEAKGKGCRTTSSDTAVRTGPYGIRYPAIVVDCGPPGPSATQASKPTLVVEIASPGTVSVDLTDKLDEYQRHDDMEVIMLVEPDTASVRVYRRDAPRKWNLEKYENLDNVIELPEVGSWISLADIYDTLNPTIRPGLRVVEQPERGRPEF